MRHVISLSKLRELKISGWMTECLKKTIHDEYWFIIEGSLLGGEFIGMFTDRIQALRVKEALESHDKQETQAAKEE